MKNGNKITTENLDRKTLGSLQPGLTIDEVCPNCYCPTRPNNSFYHTYNNRRVHNGVQHVSVNVCYISRNGICLLFTGFHENVSASNERKNGPRVARKLVYILLLFKIYIYIRIISTPTLYTYNKCIGEERKNYTIARALKHACVCTYIYFREF